MCEEQRNPGAGVVGGGGTLKQLGPSRVQAEAEVCCEACGGNGSPAHFRLVQRCCQAKALGDQAGED